MRTLTFAVASLALSACGQPAAQNTPAPAESPAPAPAPPVAPAPIDGWEIAPTAYTKLSTPLPALSGTKPDGSAFTHESLRDRWTILGLWSGETPPGEANFVAALSSAADQDPDLDVLVIHNPGTTPQPTPAWPILEDSGAIIEVLAPPATPAYLLVGPDLTIEAYRGALSSTPNEGIKGVIRGVAEIRKQISAPY